MVPWAGPSPMTQGQSPLGSAGHGAGPDEHPAGQVGAVPCGALGDQQPSRVVRVRFTANRVWIVRPASCISTTAGVGEFWFCASSVIVWRAAGVVVASATKRGCD